MRIRIVSSGIIGGVVIFLVSILLSTLLNKSIDRISANPTDQTIVQLNLLAKIIPCLLVFIVGWVAARWNWSRSWKTGFLSGAGSGLTAGAVYFWFGTSVITIQYAQIAFLARLSANSHVISESNILTRFFSLLINLARYDDNLQSFLNSLPDKSLLIDFVLSLSAPFTACLILLLCGSVFGAIGGLTSALIDRDDVWGSRVLSRDPWLFRLSGYYLVLNGLFNWAVVGIVATILDSAIRLWLKGVVSTLSAPSSLLEAFFMIPSALGEIATSILLSAMPSLTSRVFDWKVVLVDIPLALTWGWILRDWVVERKRSIASGLWLVITLGATVYGTLHNALSVPLNIVGDPISNGTGGYKILLIFISIALNLLVLGIFVVIGWNIIRAPKAHLTSYRLGDRLGYLLTCAIFGGTQTLIGIVTFAIPIVVILSSGDFRLTSANPQILLTLQDQIFSLNDNKILFLLVSWGSALTILGVNLLFALIFLWLSNFLRRLFGKTKPMSLSRESAD